MRVSAVPRSFGNAAAVTQSGHASATIPAGTTVVDFSDAYGNLVLGNNKLLTTRTGGLLSNGYVPTGLMYQQESHGLFVGGIVAICTVGDPGDLTFSRFGPDGSWPDNAGLGVAGIPNGTSLGSIRWRGAATPNGGTPDVTLGAEIQSASATIYARATEDNVKVGSSYHQGGELIFQTTPNGSSTAADAFYIRQDGKAQVGGALQVDGASTLTGAVTISTGSGKTTLVLTSASTNVGLTIGGDTTLYRSGVNALTTDGSLFVTGTLTANSDVSLPDGSNIIAGTGTGTKIGRATGQKLGFWNATPVVQQVLATGAAHTVDDVISLLQTIGLCKQA